MKAMINGVTVEGTPEEIAAFVRATEVRGGIRPVPDPPVRLGPGPRREPSPDSPEYRRIAKMLERLSQVPNVNISPLGRVCTGHMRFC